MAPSMRPKRKTPADAQFLTGDDYAEAHDLSERDAVLGGRRCRKKAKGGAASSGGQLTQEELGRIGGRCAGRIGENRYVAGVVKDSRSRCQFRGCARRCLVPGDSRLGKRPPSLRHGTSLKTTWYHLPCAFAAFRGCARKSKVVTALADIEEGLDELPAEDRALVAALIDEFNDDRAREEAARARDRARRRAARARASRCARARGRLLRRLHGRRVALDNDRFLASPGHSPRARAPAAPRSAETDDDDDVADFDFFDGFDFDEAFGPGFEEPPKPSFLAKRLLDDPETGASSRSARPSTATGPCPSTSRPPRERPAPPRPKSPRPHDSRGRTRVVRDPAPPPRGGAEGGAPRPTRSAP
ncbi:hypothetical protein SO694_00029399 [Aureococcus anophagefferens]|uniref:PARP-type domain-containing protein n=1 Tax=Aureococcus anophagefferens TaxID=44056 RepID=A0ABR1FVZ0_AURAN